FVRAVAFGNMFPEVSHADWLRWSRDLAAGVRAIVAGHPTGSFVARGIRTGSANIPVDHFFEGSAPDKPLAVYILRIGEGTGNCRAVGGSVGGMARHPGCGGARAVGVHTPLLWISGSRVRISPDRRASCGGWLRG